MTHSSLLFLPFIVVYYDIHSFISKNQKIVQKIKTVVERQPCASEARGSSSKSARERERKKGKEKRVEPMVVVEVLAPMETPQPKNHNELVTKLEVC